MPGRCPGRPRGWRRPVCTGRRRTVAVGRFDAHPGAQALVDQRVDRFVEHGVEQDRCSCEGEATAHRPPPSWSSELRRRGHPLTKAGRCCSVRVISTSGSLSAVPHDLGHAKNETRCSGRLFSTEAPARGHRRGGLAPALCSHPTPVSVAPFLGIVVRRSPYCCSSPSWPQPLTCRSTRPPVTDRSLLRLRRAPPRDRVLAGRTPCTRALHLDCLGGAA